MIYSIPHKTSIKLNAFSVQYVLLKVVQFSTRRPRVQVGRRPPEHAISFLIRLRGAHLHAFSFSANALVQLHTRTLSFSVRDSAAFCWILPPLERANEQTLMTMKVCMLIFSERETKQKIPSCASAFPLC